MNPTIKSFLAGLVGGILVVAVFLLVWTPIANKTESDNSEGVNSLENSVDNTTDTSVLDFHQEYTSPTLEEVRDMELFSEMLPKTRLDELYLSDSRYVIVDPSKPEYSNVDRRSESLTLAFDGDKMINDKEKNGIKLKLYMYSYYDGEYETDIFEPNEITESLIRDKLVSDGNNYHLDLKIKNGDALLRIQYEGIVGKSLGYVELYDMIVSARMFDN